MLQYDTIWFDMVLCDMVWYGMVWYGMVWYGMVWYGMVWYGMVWYGIVWYGMVCYDIIVSLEFYGMLWCSIEWSGVVFNTYLLGARETVRFVIPRRRCFPRRSRGKHRRSRDHKTYCFPEGPVNKWFIIISSVKVNDTIKQDKNCFYWTKF